MERLQTMMNYIFENNLNIDKATFFTVIIGQITIYGILLTFYQFVASYKKVSNQYLCFNITEYFMKKNIIVPKKLFGAILIFEILYKPFITVYGKGLSIQIINMMNFIWFASAIIYFVLFVILFFQCTKSILTLKISSNIKTNNYLVDDINENFLKKSSRERKHCKIVDLLCKDFENLHIAIQHDDNPEWQNKYDRLINTIFGKYTKKKRDEICNAEKQGIVSRKKLPDMGNASRELDLLQKIIDEKYFQLDEENIEYIFSFHINLLKSNFSIAELNGYNEISFNRYYGIAMEAEKKIFNVSKWEDSILKIYKRMDDKNRQKVIQRLYSNIHTNKNWYECFCNECIKDIIRMEIDSIFNEEREQKDFIQMFDLVIKEKDINDFCAQVVRNKIIYYNEFDAREIIMQLNKQNCTYLFTYIIIYYSIYKSRFKWNFINIKILRTLWDHHGNMHDDAEDVIEKIKKSNIEHHFEEEMYFKLVEYIDARVDGELLETVYEDKILDVFYIWIVKICVIHQEHIVYYAYRNSFKLDTQIAIVNELSNHDELLECENITNWIEYMRYDIFANQNSFPSKLNISLRCLLLTNLKVEVVVNYVTKNCYYHIDSIGKYILIKLHELPNKIGKQEQIKEIIKKAFIASNMNVDEYLDMIEKECNICNYEVNYIQKEKMKEYLIESF